MADHNLTKAEVADKAVALRSKLKIWEKEFASTHGGKKASREDIKQNPDIAGKYKEYGRLKNLEADLIRRENRQNRQRESANAQSKKRKNQSPTGPDGYSDATPRKSAKGLLTTPSHSRTKGHPSQLDPYDSPSTFRRLFSPSTHLPAPSPLKAAIGPTPQRDGKALGLFDMLSESGGSNATPSAKRTMNALGAAFQTPSKPKTFDPIAELPEEELEEEEKTRLSRTPASSTKQFYLANLFATPTTLRYAAMVEAEDETDTHNQTPKALTAVPPVNQSETPSFLRRLNPGRYPAPTTNNDTLGLSPIASRKPRQFAGRGLSHLVQGLRAMEEERLEDEWDILREIEDEQEAMNFNVPETQPEEKPYKKKGQKRTTRRVIMRPVKPQPKPRPVPTAAPVEVYEDSEDELTAVPETQLPENPSVEKIQKKKVEDDASPDEFSDFDPDLLDSDDDPEFSDKPQPAPRAKTFSERIKEAVGINPKPKPKEPVPERVSEAEEQKKSRPRKVNQEAHANYRSLKIRGKATSAGARPNGRFRRR
ncbi:hypothetical protein N7495_009755 [Penicillium taxi]|uniref:uncharacterized protein n=1 Tax=Penicillium taxi TaxID=168475 RepID=UPI0025452A13|nr:uncharacterized protein N7495_009755 [Penicillium taxi]KAJ5885245.1 hypothetical protein N7495_009755 [Penicillium taxi]